MKTSVSLGRLIRESRGRRLLGRLLQIGDEICAVLRLLQASEDHLCSGNVLLGVEQVFEEGIFTPCDALGLIGSSVSVIVGLACFAPEDSVQVGANFVAGSLVNGMTLRASLHEDFLALIDVAVGDVGLGCGIMRFIIRETS